MNNCPDAGLCMCDCDRCMEKKGGGHCKVHRNILGCHFGCTPPARNNPKRR